ncbi:MAG: 2'-5' RNA ligase family protein [Verrucomicrobiota bacterium]|nr:2'-5' RNA ligase family protein [Verrucomicrobiota bacterium]MDQ6938950.1 2'-5' RNA ligase family protein [Verrucomicrobiota bacterium]
MDASSPRLTFWLTPATQEQEFFASLIRELAVRFDAPIFKPHLTLCDGGLEEEAACEVLAKVPARPTYELEVGSIEVSARFTKTLFVRFRPSNELNHLRRSVGAALELPDSADFDPHLSLLYKEMDGAKKKELRETIALPFERVSFQGLALIAHPVKITRRADVEAWQVLARRSLGGSSR